MFTNFKAEMARYQITCTDIGKLIGKSSGWVENRLQGKANLPIDLAIKIRNEFFKNSSYDYLFSNEPNPIEKMDNTA
jgi:hypothetical protein